MGRLIKPFKADSSARCFFVAYRDEIGIIMFCSVDLLFEKGLCSLWIGLKTVGLDFFVDLTLVRYLFWGDYSVFNLYLNLDRSGVPLYLY
jgi:hypothetical protein